MWAMIVKEFRQLRRDRRTLAMMIALPVLLLVVLGYAASFDVTSIPVAVAGADAAAAARVLPAPFHVVTSDPAAGASWARDELRDGHAAVAVVTGRAGRPSVLIRGIIESSAFQRRRPLAGAEAAARQGMPLPVPGSAICGRG